MPELTDFYRNFILDLRVVGSYRAAFAVSFAGNLTTGVASGISGARFHAQNLEATGGFEPQHRGFAERCAR